MIMYGYIYLITNTVNGKKYIGQHKADKFDLKYRGSGKLLLRAYKVYSWDKFTYQILEPVNNVPTICNSLKELNNSEKYYIDYFDCVNSDEYYNLMRGGNLGGFSLEVKRVMSEKAKNRTHSPTTAGRMYVTNGILNRCLKLDDVQWHLQNGWWLGRTVSISAWNKGLTAKTSDTVKQYTEARNKHFENGGSVGCYGLVGELNYRYKSDQWIIDNIINKGFYELWENFGKCYVVRYFKLSSHGRTYNRCLELCNITPELEKLHKSEIYRRAVLNRNKKLS